MPWISDCIAGNSSEAPRPPTTAQKMTMAVTLWASVIAEGTYCVPEQAEHVRPLATDQVAHLAADQDERRRDERLERDRGLHAADGGVEILHHRGDGHVHQRGVDDQHEHGHRQENGQSSIERGLLHRATCSHPNSVSPVRELPDLADFAGESEEVRYGCLAAWLDDDTLLVAPEEQSLLLDLDGP